MKKKMNENKKKMRGKNKNWRKKKPKFKSIKISNKFETHLFNKNY